MDLLDDAKERRRARQREYQRKYRAKNLLAERTRVRQWTAENREHRRKYDADRYSLGSTKWVSNMASTARRRAERRGLPFDKAAVRELLLAPLARCPVFDVPFEVGGKQSDFSATLDRIVASRGYVRGNLALISNKANCIKNNATASEIRAVADWLEKENKKNGSEGSHA
jgi:hypothetical protein